MDVSWCYNRWNIYRQLPLALEWLMFTKFIRNNVSCFNKTQKRVLYILSQHSLFFFNFRKNNISSALRVYAHSRHPIIKLYITQSVFTSLWCSDYSCCREKGEDLHPHKTANKIRVLCASGFTFLDRRLEYRRESKNSQTQLILRD